MADLVQLIVFNLNHESCLAKDVERELLEEYRLALVGSEGICAAPTPRAPDTAWPWP